MTQMKRKYPYVCIFRLFKKLIKIIYLFLFIETKIGLKSVNN